MRVIQAAVPYPSHAAVESPPMPSAPPIDIVSTPAGNAEPRPRPTGIRHFWLKRVVGILSE